MVLPTLKNILLVIIQKTGVGEIYRKRDEQRKGGREKKNKEKKVRKRERNREQKIRE